MIPFNKYAAPIPLRGGSNNMERVLGEVTVPMLLNYPEEFTGGAFIDMCAQTTSPEAMGLQERMTLRVHTVRDILSALRQCETVPELLRLTRCRKQVMERHMFRVVGKMCDFAWKRHGELCRELTHDHAMAKGWIHPGARRSREIFSRIKDGRDRGCYDARITSIHALSTAHAEEFLLNMRNFYNTLDVEPESWSELTQRFQRWFDSQFIKYDRSRLHPDDGVSKVVAFARLRLALRDNAFTLRLLPARFPGTSRASVMKVLPFFSACSNRLEWWERRFRTISAMSGTQQHTYRGQIHRLFGLLRPWTDCTDAAHQSPGSALSVELLPHQVQGVEWLRRVERGANFDWMRVKFQGGDYVYYSPYFNEFIGHLPVTPAVGGILADAMGLGKTIQILSLIAKDLEATADEESAPDFRRATLIVVPPSILGQWVSEVEDKAPHLTVLRFHGPRRPNSSAVMLARHAPDIVITTYRLVLQEWKRGSSSALHEQVWRRVVFDESHVVKNHLAQTFKACKALISVRRWCVSATPGNNMTHIMNQLNLCHLFDALSRDITEASDDEASPDNDAEEAVALNRCRSRRMRAVGRHNSNFMAAHNTLEVYVPTLLIS